MEDIVDVREGTFIWKIGAELGGKRSSEFKFGKYNCFLCIDELQKGTPGHCYKIDIYKGIYSQIRYKTFCKLCLIYGSGKEHLETKQTTLPLVNCAFIPLMTISKYALDSDVQYRLSDGVTLRLSWCDLKDINRDQESQTPLDLNSEEVPRKLLRTLSEDYGRIYESKVDTDFLLRVGDDLIPVHRTVLAARSEVFAAMFRHDTSEKQSGVVDIPDVDVSVLSDVLHYVYSGQTRGMSADTIVPMYIVADKYALIELRDTCRDFLMRSLTVENVCDVAVLAHIHGETKLEKEVANFVKGKLKEIEETDQWKELLKSKPSLALKILRSVLTFFI